jgi:uncharacterized protein YbjT (DUF2867 family)
MITVMGVTGHTGKKITEALLNAGEKVRALGRSESKLAELKRAGAEALIGDATDAAFLTKAFHGADAVYTLLPTDPSNCSWTRASRPCRRSPMVDGASTTRRIPSASTPRASTRRG